jgi:DHA2 family multidrug resistance protein
MEMLNNMTQRFSSYGSDAQQMALKQLNSIVHRQGVVMAFGDVFLVLTLLFVALAVLALLVKRPAGAASAGGGH